MPLDLPPQVIINILNIFQSNLDNFIIPLLTPHQFLPLLNVDEQRVFATIMNRLEPADPSLQPYQYDARQHSRLVVPRGATREQQRFVRVSPEVNTAFSKLTDHYKSATRVSLVIESGYRSPAYQALLIMGTYYRNGFDIAKTLREINPPGYSEHQDPSKPAIDITAHGMAMDDQVFASEVYPWLRQNAGTYGFIESYPQTQSAMIWEPWHWKLQ
jgi:LAS superfamily LD-carboxypeptidase LdcB